jgi:hypothetical protein
LIIYLYLVVAQEYVVVLLRNGRRKDEAAKELQVFLGDDNDAFVSWLSSFTLTFPVSFSFHVPCISSDNTMNLCTILQVMGSSVLKFAPICSA